jgi:hypothetical protein
MDIPNELQDTPSDVELDMPISQIIADQAKKSRPMAGTGRKQTAAQAALDEPQAKTTTFTQYKGGSTGHKSFSVVELELLNECMSVAGFEGGDLWMKVSEKYSQECHLEWPARCVNSLKKKFTEVIILFLLLHTNPESHCSYKIDDKLEAKDRQDCGPYPYQMSKGNLQVKIGELRCLYVLQ